MMMMMMMIIIIIIIVKIVIRLSSPLLKFRQISASDLKTTVTNDIDIH